MEKNRLLEVVKIHSDRDAIGMILSNYADRCSSEGALISVNQFYKIADVLIEWEGQKPDASENTLPIDGVVQQRELLIAYEIHMLNPTEKEHRKYWAERTVDRYLSNL